MVRVAICDDEKEVLDQLSGYLGEMPMETQEGLEIHCFQASEEIVFELEEGWRSHIVFLDIELGEENGLRIARCIREQSPAALIIFITGHEQYVYECFEVQPVDFIRKPLQKDKVVGAFQRALKRCDVMPVWEYTQGSTMFQVPLSEICFFISEQRKVTFQTEKGKQAYYGRIDEVEKRLLHRSVNFIRISKSVIVNLRYVREIHYERIVLACGNASLEFSISQAYRVRVRKYCMEIWKR